MVLTFSLGINIFIKQGCCQSFLAPNQHSSVTAVRLLNLRSIKSIRQEDFSWTVLASMLIRSNHHMPFTRICRVKTCFWLLKSGIVLEIHFAIAFSWCTDLTKLTQSRIELSSKGPYPCPKRNRSIWALWRVWRKKSKNRKFIGNKIETFFLEQKI
jgi:hypothetical protein